MTIQELQASFASRALVSGSCLILSAADAVALVHTAERERFPVLGIDGFHLDGGQVEPDLSFSVDFSTNASQAHGSWSDANAFIQSNAAQVDGFEIVLGEYRVGAA